MLLDRDTFRRSVFDRDRNRCVVCGKTGPRLDAHHVMERRLFTAPHQTGGYFLDNGATLCDDGTLASCHLRAEATLLSCDEIRDAAGIRDVILPDHLYADQPFTKWGDPIMPNGLRMRGELFGDESVRKVLAAGDVLRLYTNRVKYPRTYHLPASPKVKAGDIGDDKVMPDYSGFYRPDGSPRRVVATVKMDGAQCTMYRDYLHGRTVDFKSDQTWHWLQNYHARFAFEIPEDWRLCAENLWLAHAIQYQNLPLYVAAFGLWDDRNVCLGWDAFVEWCDLFGAVLIDSGVPQGLPRTPVLYDGPFDPKMLDDLYPQAFGGDPCEGYVLRVADEFPYREFRHRVGKFVRADHRPRHGGLHGSEWRVNHLAPPSPSTPA